MSGMATVKDHVSFEDVDLDGITNSFSVDGIDEGIKQIRELAAEAGENTGWETLSVGSVDTIHGLFIKLLVGGTTLATGLDIHLASATWADQNYNIILKKGQSVHIPNVQLTTLSVKNLNSSTAKYAYLIFGANA